MKAMMRALYLRYLQYLEASARDRVQAASAMREHHLEQARRFEEGRDYWARRAASAIARQVVLTEVGKVEALLKQRAQDGARAIEDAQARMTHAVGKP